MWCKIWDPTTAGDCPECERLEREYPPNGPCILPKYIEEHKPEKFCKYCGGQNLKEKTQIVFGDATLTYTYTCIDCEEKKRNEKKTAI